MLLAATCSGLTNPHDKFFKETFSHIEVARDFFANYLPEAVTAVLNLDTLALQPDSFIDADLQEQFADLLYSVQLANGRDAYLYAYHEWKRPYWTSTAVFVSGWMLANGRLHPSQFIIARQRPL